MRILLVRVARWVRYVPSEPERLVLSPPLGLLHLAAYLRTYRGDEVRIVDLKLRGPRGRQDTLLRDALRDFRPHVVGLSALTFEHRSCHEAALLVRHELPSATVVVGGPHASMYPRRTLVDRNINYVVVGEGEESLTALLDGLEGGDEMQGLPGVGCVRDGRIVLGPQRVPTRGLDEHPIPAWDQYRPEAHMAHEERMSLVHAYQPFAAIQTTRGCPFRCTFCHDIFGKKLRKRPVDSVLEELELLASLGVRDVEVYDDAFNADRAHMWAVLEGVRARELGLRFSFANGLRADLLDRDDLRLLKETRTTYLALAIESPVPRIQALTRKNLDLDKVRESMREATRLRLFTAGFFMLGFPDETMEEMRATVDFACRSPLHAAFFFTVVPHPATELGREVGMGELAAPIDDWDYHLGKATLARASAASVIQLQRDAYRRFFSCPRRGLRALRDMPSKRKVVFGLKRLIRSALPLPGQAYV